MTLPLSLPLSLPLPLPLPLILSLTLSLPLPLVPFACSWHARGVQRPVFLWRPHGETGLALLSALQAASAGPLVAVDPEPGFSGAPAAAAVEVCAPGDDAELLVTAVSSVVDRWGPPRGLVLTPPPPPPLPFHELGPQQWSDGVVAPLMAAVTLLRAVLPAASLAGGGRVVLVLPAPAPPAPHRRAGQAAGVTLAGALSALVGELSREPAGEELGWYRVEEGRPPEGAVEGLPAPALRAGADGTAALVAWLVTCPASPSGAPWSPSWPAARG